MKNYLIFFMFLFNLQSHAANFPCGQHMEKKQCDAMNRWTTTAAVSERAKHSVSGSYCDGTLTSAACNEKRNIAVKTNCVTKKYADFLKTIPLASGGKGLAPACEAYKTEDHTLPNGMPVTVTYSRLIGFCKCGCFPKDTNLFVSLAEGDHWLNADNLFTLLI